MMDYGGLISIGAGILGGLTKPKRPNVPEYKPELLEKRNIEDYEPQLKSLVDSQADIASSLLNGDLPKGVVDQIKTFAGEAAQRGGFGETLSRVGNLTARDLGLTALDAMAQGQQYAGFVQNYAQDQMNIDMAIETGNANMLYDQWASKAENIMRDYEDSTSRHQQFWQSMASGGSQLVTAYGNHRNQQQVQADYRERTKALKDMGTIDPDLANKIKESLVSGGTSTTKRESTPTTQKQGYEGSTWKNPTD